MKQYYKIMDVSNKGVKTLFHANEGSKVVPMGKWLTSSRKRLVSDGSSSTKYVSGWHTFRTFEEAKKYLYHGFTNLEEKVILSCYVKEDVRPKSHSRADVWLSDKIFLKKIVYRHKNCLTTELR